MHKPVKYAEKGLTYVARGGWAVFERLNRVKPNPSFTPKWSEKPLLKSYQKTKPPLGWPRSTDSLCPRCVPEIRQQILDGELPHEILLNEKVGEIKAQIIEREIAKAGLQLVADQFFGDSYARTLEQWRLRFHSAWPAIEGLGFDERFKRTWEYYLAYCQVGFETGALNVGLYKVTRATSI